MVSKLDLSFIVVFSVIGGYLFCLRLFKNHIHFQNNEGQIIVNNKIKPIIPFVDEELKDENEIREPKFINSENV